MKEFARFAISKALIAIFLSFTFMLCPRLMITSARSAQEQLKLRSQSELRTQAGLYDTAIREIGRVATMQLETIDDLKTANSIIRKHSHNLRYSRPKLVVMGLADSTFVAALKEKTRDTQSTNAFALELSRDENAILKLNGASALADRITRSVKADATLLRRVSERLKKVSDDVKARIKPHHVVSSEVLSKSLEVENSSKSKGSSVAPMPERGFEAIVLVAVGAVMFPVLGVAIVGIALGAVLVGKLITTIGTDEGRDRMAECQNNADAKHSSCVEAGKDLCCGLAVVNEAACTAVFLLESAACLLA